MVVVKKEKLKQRIKLALDWLSEIAQKKDEKINKATELNILKAQHQYWKGAIRSEYLVAEKKWNFYAPIWHSGQALKSLVLGSQLDFINNDDKNKYLNSAEEIANFTFNNQIWDEKNPDHGLILAYEDIPGKITTSGILEAAHGFFLLSEITNNNLYKNKILGALNFCAEKLYIKGKGLFHDSYDVKNREIADPYQRSGSEPGRPLNDDSMFLKAYKLTKDERYKIIFWEVIDKLIKEENPPGNWVKYFPCVEYKGDIHPRHAFWWGRPFIRAYNETKEKKYLEIAKRAGEWYKKAIRRDGGLFRRTYTDFNTDSFGHATSGAACAVILWLELKEITGTKEYNSLIRNSISYCMKMQFINPLDNNLLGCILEKVLPPNGTDRNPYFIRDLGTIFFIQAAVEYLKGS